MGALWKSWPEHAAGHVMLLSYMYRLILHISSHILLELSTH